VNRPYDLIALAVRSDMIAVGGMRHVILVDPRAPRSAPSNLFLESPDVTNGVRSVSFSNNILTYGTGHGKIAFYDLRAGKYLPTLYEGQVARCNNVHDTATEGLSPGPYEGRAAINVRLPYVEAPKQCLQTGSGWIMQDETFMDMFALFGHTLRHACYAHAWDKSCTRLFTCGGPLECGLTGGYAAIWE
jgi:WD repeat-containing protein 40A